MKKVRKNLVRIEALLIAIIMTVSMFGNVNTNAAEIQGDVIASKTVIEDADASELIMAAEDATTVGVKAEEASGVDVEDVTEKSEKIDTEEVFISEEKNGNQDEIEKIEISETVEASEEI